MYPKIIFSTDSTSWRKKNNLSRKKTPEKSQISFLGILSGAVKNRFHTFFPSFLFFDLAQPNTSASSMLIISNMEREGKRETHKCRHTPGRAAESEVKEAQGRGLRALIHHLITSAVCVRSCVFLLLLLRKLTVYLRARLLHIYASV